MSIDILANVTRDNIVIYQRLSFQIDRMSAMEALSYSLPPYYSYSGFVLGNVALRQNDFLVDLVNKDPVTGQPKAYTVMNEPEQFLDHVEFNCIRADRAAITRGT